jgi:hypothetical protein
MRPFLFRGFGRHAQARCWACRMADGVSPSQHRIECEPRRSDEERRWPGAGHRSRSAHWPDTASEGVAPARHYPGGCAGNAMDTASAGVQVWLPRADCAVDAPCPRLRRQPCAEQRYRGAGIGQAMDTQGSDCGPMLHDERPFAARNAIFFYSRGRTGDHSERPSRRICGNPLRDAYAGFNRFYAAAHRPVRITEAALLVAWSAQVLSVRRYRRPARGTLPVIAPLALDAVKRIDAIFESRARSTTYPVTSASRFAASHCAARPRILRPECGKPRGVGALGRTSWLFAGSRR